MKSLDFGLEGKVAIITGSGKGIGAGIAQVLAGLGAKVVIHDLDEEKVSTELHKLKDEGSNAIGVVGDINDPQVREKLVSETLGAFGRIDFLVNNVSIGAEGDFPEIAEANWDKVIHTNLNSPFHLTQLVGKEMIQNPDGGGVVFITSVHKDEPGVSLPYSASKSALKMVIKELALRLARSNIRVNGVAPGAIHTSEARVEEKQVPLGKRSGTTTEIGRSVAFLLSPTLSSYTTGTIVTVDGGLSLVNWISKD